MIFTFQTDLKQMSCVGIKREDGACVGCGGRGMPSRHDADDTIPLNNDVISIDVVPLSELATLSNLNLVRDTVACREAAIESLKTLSNLNKSWDTPRERKAVGL